MTEPEGCPVCGSEDIWSQERVTVLYAVRRDKDGVRYRFRASEVQDDTAEPFGLYCREGGHEWTEEIA